MKRFTVAALLVFVPIFAHAGFFDTIKSWFGIGTTTTIVEEPIAEPVAPPEPQEPTSPAPPLSRTIIERIIQGPTTVTTVSGGGVSYLELQNAITALKSELEPRIDRAMSSPRSSGEYSDESDGLSVENDGTEGYVLQFDGDDAVWVATSSLGISSGGAVQWVTSGSDLYYTTGNVGIGTTSPYAALSVVGTVAVTGNIDLATSSLSGSVGVITQEGYPFIHSYGDASYADLRSNFFAGRNAGNFTSYGGFGNIGIGALTLHDLTDAEGNIAIGSYALASTTEGSYNIAIGENALYKSLESFDNIAIGTYSMREATTSDNFENTALGGYTLRNLTDGYNNIAIGYQTTYTLTTGSGNVVIGDYAYNSVATGTENTGLGYTALSKIKGTYNVGLGAGAAWGASSGGGFIDKVTAVGAYSGKSIRAGSTGSIFLGYQAGDNVTTGGSNIIIGYDVDAPSATTNGQLVIGNLIYGTGVDGTGTGISTGKVGIGTSSPFAKLSVHGKHADSLTHLFAVATSTLTSTTTAFSISRTGGITLFSAYPTGTTGNYLCLNTSTFAVTSGTTCSASSLRFKTDIQDLSYGLDDVMKLRPVTFRYKEEVNPDTSVRLGLIAEEVQGVIPEVVWLDAEGKPESVAYDNLVSLLIKAVQELNERIDTLVASVANVASVITDKVTTKELCVEDVCVTRDEFLEILENANIDQTPDPTPDPETPPADEPPVENPPADEPPSDEPLVIEEPPVEEPPVEESAPESIPEPTPEPIVEG